jgi:hypothetical protein
MRYSYKVLMKEFMAGSQPSHTVLLPDGSEEEAADPQLSPQRLEYALRSRVRAKGRRRQQVVPPAQRAWSLRIGRCWSMVVTWCWHGAGMVLARWRHGDGIVVAPPRWSVAF